VIKEVKQSTKLIFSGGTGRSGTTIIGKLLGRHPEVRLSQPVEIKFLAANAGLIDLTFGRRDFIELKKRKSWSYRLLSRVPGFTEWSLAQNFRRRLRHDWWDSGTVPGKGVGLSSGVSVEIREEAYERFKRERRRDPRSAALTFFWKMIESQSNNQGEPNWIDTSPPNIFNADRIHSLLPEARFIHMKRDGRNTIASVLKEHWGPSDPMAAIYWWKNRIIASHQALAKVPEGQVIEIQLEELAQFDRESQYQRLLGFLELSDAPAMREYFDHEVKGERVVAARWQEELNEAKFLDRFRKVHRELADLGIEAKLYD